MVLRISAFNPNFIMPSQHSITLTVNYPPSGFTFGVTPTTGTAMETQFSLSVTGATDQDNNLPLVCKFDLYLSEDLMNEDINRGRSFNKMSLT